MKKLFSAMAVLVLAAASAVPVPNNTVSGKIIDWPAGETGTLRLAPLAGGMTLVSAAIDAAGNFKLTLPDPPERGLVSVADLFSPASSVRTNCRGSGTAAPDDGQVQVFYLNVLKNGQSFGDVTYDNFPTMLPRPDSVSGTLLYFSKPTRLDGEVTCGPDLSDMVLRGEFPAGWQLVLTEVRPGKTVDSALETYRPELAVPELQWRLFKEYGGVGIHVRRDSTIVESFRPGGPAETSELQSGDEILTIDGKAVKTYTDTAALIGDAGSVVTLTVRRAGVEQPLTIHIKRALVRWP